MKKNRSRREWLESHWPVSCNPVWIGSSISMGMELIPGHPGDWLPWKGRVDWRRLVPTRTQCRRSFRVPHRPRTVTVKTCLLKSEVASSFMAYSLLILLMWIYYGRKDSIHIFSVRVLWLKWFVTLSKLCFLANPKHFFPHASYFCRMWS